ncbi:MAG: iron ABC transporter permease [Lachnospiraceae bacterium]|nr:iron ABC transporter permease [Lachnospiraceae bacterium]
MKKKNENNNFNEHISVSRVRYGLFFFFMFVLFAVITVLNINIGSVNISVPEIFKIIFLKQGDKGYYNIIWHIRLPRICMAALLGGALSLSGLLLQIFFNNPIAGPYILGISSGAKMVVALTLIVFLDRFGSVSSIILILASFIGAMISIGFILLLSKYIKSMSVLLIGGIMINYICSAITDFIVTFASDADIVNLRGWSLGSFSASNWRNFHIAFVVVIVTSVIIFLLSKPISAYQLGEDYARSMGVNIRTFRVVLILLSSILSACVTAFAGPISFVGIAVPHLVKRGLGTTKPIIVIPACFIGGGIFCMFCDLLARTMFAPTELNISTVTAIFGAPIVIAMLLSRKRNKQ